MRFVASAAGAVVLLLAPISASYLRAEALPSGLERLTFDVEWRLIHAGIAVIETRPSDARVKLDSAGLVSTLFKVDDTYQALFRDEAQMRSRFCAASTSFDAQEGHRHREVKVSVEPLGGDRSRVSYVERDVLRNADIRREQIDATACVHEVVGAIAKLRELNLAPGQAAQLPVTDGRHAAMVRVEAQEREQVKTDAGTFDTIRYEANLMNGVVYARKGRAFIWLTDDARHLPVQIRLRMAFPVGTVTLGLVKDEKP